MKPQKTQRQLQVGEQIKRIIADALLKKDDFIIPGIYITVIRADVSPDIKNVRILLDIFGESAAKPKDNLVKDINNTAPYFKAIIAKQIRLRYTPEIVFVVDDSFEEANKIEDLIRLEATKFSAHSQKPGK
jgi:ribosome-binding factor A